MARAQKTTQKKVVEKTSQSLLVYDPKKIEIVLQKKWEKEKPFKALTSSKTKKKPFYVLSMFPYPSGAGLHVGHPRSYTATDIVARKKRMEGFNVLNPMGYDAFGLPAEQFAIQNKVHPKKAVEMNIRTFEGQLKKLGFSFDWDRKINTTDPEYYKWTQWIFLKLYNSYYDTTKKKASPIEGLIKVFEKKGNENITAFTSEQAQIFDKKEWLAMSALQKQEVLMRYRLAYEGEAQVNWCQELGTVLANDEIIDTKEGPVSERGGYPVTKKNIRQWFLRITAYADRLLSGLDTILWPNHVKEIQRNWIGKSEGAEISFVVNDAVIEKVQPIITVFTTRPDTLFGVTFLAISAELAQEWITVGWQTSSEIKEYMEQFIQDHQKTDFDASKNKTGIFAGVYAINPVNQEKIPVWIANYVLPGYGTGAVMGVPAHDKRDFEFALNEGISIKQVILIENKKEIRQTVRYTGSSYTYPVLFQYLLDDIKDVFFYTQVGENICNQNEGVLQNSGKFDGLISQEAKKVITESVGGKLVTRYKMRDAIFARQRYWGEPIPLYKDKIGIIHEVKKLPLTLPNTTSYEPTGTGEGPLANIASWKKAGYETNTMPGWAGSSWYHIRYMDAQNKNMCADPKEVKYWKQVDTYLGGAEHATGHLLYSRFWHKVLKDYGLVPTEEPFKQLVTHGFILASDGRKMSKRWGNVVNPDDVIATYGADTTRLYIAFMGPYGEAIPWSDESIVGCRRFIERLYKKAQNVLSDSVTKTDVVAEKAIHKLIDKITKDIESFSFNTAVAKAMETINIIDGRPISKKDYSLMVQVLNPFIPHVTEYLWGELENKGQIHTSMWPKVNKKLLVEDEVTIGVQINGKLRATITVPSNSTENFVKETALKEENVVKYIKEKEIIKLIYVPNRIINMVIIS